MLIIIIHARWCMLLFIILEGFLKAPEQLKAKCVTCKVDVYAFGCVFVELFGEHPLWGDLEPLQIMFKVGVEERVPEYTHLPLEVQSLCQMCLQTEEDKRVTAVRVLKCLLDLSKAITS